jgi:hypothetical protein
MRAIPRSFFSWDFDVVESGKALCAIDQGYWRERASFSLAGRTYTLGRESGFGDFWVREGGEGGPVLCHATKVSAFRRRFDIVIDGTEFVLAPRSLFGFSYDLTSGSAVVGSISRVSLFRRELELDLPDELPVAARVFLLWLVLLMKRRSRRRNR